MPIYLIRVKKGFIMNLSINIPPESLNQDNLMNYLQGMSILIEGNDDLVDEWEYKDYGAIVMAKGPSVELTKEKQNAVRMLGFLECNGTWFYRMN